MYTYDLLGAISHNCSVPVVLAQLCMLRHNCCVCDTVQGQVPYAALSVRVQIVHACVCDNAVSYTGA